MKKVTLILFVCINVLKIFAQQITSQADPKEIVNRINISKEDTNKVHALYEYARWWETRNSDSAFLYLQQAEKLSKHLKFPKGEAEVLSRYIAIYQIQGKYEEMLSASNKLLSFSKEVKNTYGEIKGLLMIGTAYQSLGDVQKFLDYHLLAQKRAEQENMLLTFPNIPYNIGGALLQMGETEKSFPYFLESIELCKKAKNDFYLCVSYYNYALALTTAQKFDTANYYYGQSLEVSEKIHYDQFVSVNLAGLSSTYYQLSQYEKGLPLAKKAIKIAQSSDYFVGEVYGYAALYANYFGLKDYSNALLYGEKFRKIIESEQMAFDFYGEYPLLAKVYAAVGNYKESYECQLFYESMNDSVANNKIKEKISLTEAKYKTAQKEKQILQLQKEKQKQTIFIFGLISGLVIFIVISFLINRNIAIRKRITEQQLLQLQQEKQLEATKTILKVQEEERGRVAKDLHDGLGGMLSGIKLNLSAMKGNVILQHQDAGLFAKSIEQLDNAISEMRRVAHNMMPESLLKFGLTQAIQDYCESINESKIIQLAYKDIGMNERLDNSIEIVLYRIIQELVNNAIKHAQAQHVIIQLVKNEKNVTLTVEDDGKGFDVNVLEKIKGFGLSNIQSRVDYLKGNLEIDSQNNIGTSFYITIPV